MKKIGIVLPLVLVGIVSASVFAQGRRGPGAQSPERRSMERRAELHAGEKVVTGAPYSAVAVTTRVQTLANGTKLTRKSEATIYRDSAGRIRREQAASRINPLGPMGREVDVPATIFISDPVAGVAYTLFPDKKIGIKRVFKPSPDEGDQPAGRRQGALRTRNGQAGKNSERNDQELGQQLIEGVEVVGKRTVATIPVDQIGNDQPIEIVNERWVSKELKTLVRSRHNDPRLGENSFDLTRIDRSEPPSSLFIVPEGYTISNAGRMGGRMGGPMGGPMGGKSGLPRRGSRTDIR